MSRLLLQNNQPKPIQEIEAKQQATKQIKISSLKQFALDNLPTSSSLRDLMNFFEGLKPHPLEAVQQFIF
jgi:hypothetical protein